MASTPSRHAASAPQPDSNHPAPRRARRGRGRAFLVALVLAATAVGAPTQAPDTSAACGSFQSMVDSAASGSTITIPPCTYTEIVEVRKPLTINAAGVTIDGGDTRAYGIKILASDVTVNGLTVTRVKGGAHVGAVWTTGISRFTFRDGVARDSATVCVSLNGGSGHRILDSRMTGCGKEGYFANGTTDILFRGNRIDHNNTDLAFDPQSEAGGGKVMASSGVTFDSNEVDHNGGPGIWFDNGVSNVTVINNSSHDNHESGIMFEISSNATISNNAVWNNGFGHAAWGFGAGILVSSSDGARIIGNTVAWNARGISVISQGRNLSPHSGNEIRDNVIVSQGGSFVAGFYDDHGGSLFTNSNSNSGSGNRYWIGAAEPSNDRFHWSGPRSTLSAYNGTPGEDGGSYLSTSARDAALAAAGIGSSGTPPPAPKPPAPPPAPKPPTPPKDPAPPKPSAPKPDVETPTFSLRTGRHGLNDTVPARIRWGATAGASRYQLQLKRVGGEYVTVPLPTATARSKAIVLLTSKDYRARLRVKVDGRWSDWATSATIDVDRAQETNAAIDYDGTWIRRSHPGASGGHLRAASDDGASATFEFTGRSVAWVAPKGPSRGSAEVWVDGSYRTTIDLRRSGPRARAVVFATSWSGRGDHTIEIKVLGTDGHPRVDVDAFIVLD